MRESSTRAASTSIARLAESCVGATALAEPVAKAGDVSRGLGLGRTAGGEGLLGRAVGAVEVLARRRRAGGGDGERAAGGAGLLKRAAAGVAAAGCASAMVSR